VYYGEPFSIGSFGEISVGADQRPTLRAIPAPHQSGGQLEGVRRAKFVDAEQPLGSISNAVGWLNLVPAAAQIVEAREGLFALLKI
jgi:hypothetical protein